MKKSLSTIFNHNNIRYNKLSFLFVGKMMIYSLMAQDSLHKCRKCLVGVY